MSDRLPDDELGLPMGAPPDVDGMHTAWFKAVVLHVCLWSQPYAAEQW